MPGTPPYEPLGPPVRVPRMWGVARDPIATLGTRGVHGFGRVVVFWALSVAAVESLCGQPGSTVCTGAFDFALVTTDPIAAAMASCGLL